MAAVKIANIIPFVAMVVIIFSVTIHAFPEGLDSSSTIKKLTEGKLENSGSENKKKSDEAPAAEKGSEKSVNQSEKKTEDDKKTNADKLAEKIPFTKLIAKALPPKSKLDAEKSDKSADKQTDKSDIKQDQSSAGKKLEKVEKSDKADKEDKKE